MQTEKRRPNLELLREMGPAGWRLEVAQACEDATDEETKKRAESLLTLPDGELTPEAVMSLREQGEQCDACGV